MDVEYGINIKNKFTFLMDDEDDPESVVLRAESAALKKEEKSKTDKKTEKKEPKKPTSATPAPAATANTKNGIKDEKKPPQNNQLPANKFAKPPMEKSEGNKENRPDTGEFGGSMNRGGGRGGRGMGGGFRGEYRGRGRGGPPRGEGPTNLPPRLAGNKDDGFANSDNKDFQQGDRFGEGGGFRGRGSRRPFGRGGPRGGGGFPRRGGGMFNSEHQDSGDMNAPHPGGDTWQGNEGDGNRGGGMMGTFGDEEGEKQAFGGNNGGQDFGGNANFRGGRGRGGYNRDRGEGFVPYEGGRGGRGEGRGRGGRGRQFDRNSGSDKTGIRPQEKRAGYGKGNWGTKEDELQGETETLNTTAGSEGEAKVETEATNEKREEHQDEETQREPDEQEKTMTYEQWLAQKEKRAQPAFNIRQPEQDKSLKVLKTKLDESTDGEEIIVEKRPVKKQVLNIEVEFIKDQDRIGGGEGRGRGRGDFRGGRGGERGMGRGGGRPRHDDDNFNGGGERGRGRGEFSRGGRGMGRGGGGSEAPRGNRGGRGGSASYKLDTENFPELGSATA